jgi:threonine dehydratase
VTIPGSEELEAARRFVAERHPRTPLRTIELDDGVTALVKCENEAPVRSFKARGALWSLSRLSGAARERGVVTASTGNHSQGVSYAGRALGVPVTIAMPTGTSEVKVRRTRALGGEVRLVDGDLSEAEAEARRIAADNGPLYLEDGEDPGFMAGAATIAWEVLDEAPDVEALIVPVGGGNLIAGVGLVAKHVNPAIEVIGVQSSAAPAVARSFAAGRVVEAECRTIAAGLATSHPGRLSFAAIREHVDELHTVEDAELCSAVVRTLERTGQLIEPAAAAPFVLLGREPARWRGRRVAVVQTGGNVGMGELRAMLDAA